MKLAPAILAALLAMPVSAADRLTILHTNDFHSRIEPINKYDSGCGVEDNEAGKCFGGSARLITAIRDRRASADASILVDGGDQFQGTLFYTTYKGLAAAEMMNALGYDAMTVGNHEFDDGPRVLRAFMAAVEFPVLLANADVSAEPELADVLKPSIVLERGGRKYGLIGLTPQNTYEIASPGPNITFSDPATALTAEIARLEAEGIDRIIVLSHSGYRVDKRIAAAVAGIDVIVGGHSNTYLANGDGAEGPYPTWIDAPDGGRTAIVQAYAYGKFLGELHVDWNEDGTVADAAGGPILIDGNVTEDAALQTRIAELAKGFEAVRNRVVAEAATPIGGDREFCRSRECEMGNLVADAMLARVKSQGVDFAITNAGGLRASIDAGPVTMGEVLTVLPFQNALSTFKLTGADVIAALENGVSQVEEGAGRFPQVAGLSYVWNRAAAPMEGRIAEVKVLTPSGPHPLDPKAVYSVVSNDYMRSGGDGYGIFAEKAVDAYDFGPSLEDVVADYLAKNGPYTPYLDGRIAEQ